MTDLKSIKARPASYEYVSKVALRRSTPKKRISMVEALEIICKEHREYGKNKKS